MYFTIRQHKPPDFTNYCFFGRLIKDFVFGANEKMLRTQRYVDPDHEFRVTTDIDGNGTYFGVAKSPIISVKHAKAAAFSATAPSQAAIGKPFKVLIRAEDSNYSLGRFENTFRVNITEPEFATQLRART